MSEHEALDILQEEAAEIIQCVSKIKRFGIDSCHPYQDVTTSNREHLMTEIGDMLALIDIVQQKYDLDIGYMVDAKNQKFEKLKKWSTVLNSIPTSSVTALKPAQAIKQPTKSKLRRFLPWFSTFGISYLLLLGLLNHYSEKNLLVYAAVLFGWSIYESIHDYLVITRYQEHSSHTTNQ